MSCVAAWVSASSAARDAGQPVGEGVKEGCGEGLGEGRGGTGGATVERAGEGVGEGVGEVSCSTADDAGGRGDDGRAAVVVPQAARRASRATSAKTFLTGRPYPGRIVRACTRRAALSLSSWSAPWSRWAAPGSTHSRLPRHRQAPHRRRRPPSPARPRRPLHHPHPRPALPGRRAPSPRLRRLPQRPQRRAPRTWAPRGTTAARWRPASSARSI